MTDPFQMVGMRPEQPPEPVQKVAWYRGKPVFAAVLLTVIVLCCLFSEAIMTKDPTYMDLTNCNVAPNGEFLFGTDAMGRDIFSMIWYGGRVSLLIGILATGISTVLAVVFGAASGMAPSWVDTLLMRLTEILMSIPGLLLVLLLQAILGQASVWSLSLVIGLTGWTAMAKVVRTEVRQLRSSEYVVAARCMGGGFFYLLWKHLTPNFFSSILFMMVMNVRSAMVTESTLSFMGMGLPLEVVSWGSMLSLAEKALMTSAWWVILIPGIFLVATLLSITSLGNCLRKQANRKARNL